MKKKNILPFVLLLFFALRLSAQSDASVTQHAWFKVSKINQKVWRIADGEVDNIYLIEGRDSALLIDTGIGAADLAMFVKSITRLPLIVVNTHSHPDHTGSSYQFAKVYAHPDDFEMIKFFSAKERRKAMLKNMRLPIADAVKAPAYDSSYRVALAPVREGYIFNLGDRKIEVIHVPGHTPGSICLLDHKDKSLYTGDNNNTLVWLHTQDALPLEIYLGSLKKLTNRSREFQTLYPGHGAPLEKSFILDQITCVEQIIDGTCQGKPYESFAGNGLLCGYGKAQVAYDPLKIKSKK